ncbi:retrovirus-related Pol polyprotein from transposon 297 [Trichonephila inaurata madagascariensis]|uniref:Retrovirus-related Pol polyprotein from transposon 297 n=1 Tax=Trichonephila inaurata madagascariensis TaxID=2747483 RepID=A0A8X6XVP8_9ARAC|nr:retrovirus-related Pol polyprotein from transposon 297 [Trichonephila inaurata madagascariensis]
MEDGSERELHFNKLRPYEARIEQIGLIFDQDNEFGDLHYAPTDSVELDVNDIYKHVMDSSAGLENSQKHQLADLLSKFSDVFSSVPGSAKVKGHSVSLMLGFVPKKLKPYRIPIALQEKVNKQINDLLQLGLIEPSESEWAHPILVLPLTNLTKKNIPKDIPWESSAEDSFVKLKEELVKMPSLHTPDLSRPFLLFTDASATAIGACLAQHSDHMEEMPIAFFSKKLALSKMKWSTIDREAFSVLEALRKFDTWIFVSQIQVISDHDPLTYLRHLISIDLNFENFMDLIKNCDRYKNDPDSVHELANLIIEERKSEESQQLELEKRKKSKLDLEIARIRANDKDNNTEINCNDSSSLDSL